MRLVGFAEVDQGVGYYHAVVAEGAPVWWACADPRPRPKSEDIVDAVPAGSSLCQSPSCQEAARGNFWAVRRRDADGYLIDSPGYMVRA